MKTTTLIGIGSSIGCVVLLIAIGSKPAHESTQEEKMACAKVMMDSASMDYLNKKAYIKDSGKCRGLYINGEPVEK